MKLCHHHDSYEAIRFLLIAAGFSAMALSLFADFVGIGHPGFGLKQLLVLLTGFLLVMAGFLKIHLLIDTNRARILSIIYLCLLLFAGLKPRNFKHFHYSRFLEVGKLNWTDIFINTVGFFLLAYLLMMSFGIAERTKKSVLFKRAAMVACFGTCISLLFEISQYFFIQGRNSSLIDLVTNIIGTLTGVVLYILIHGRESGMIKR